MKKLITNSLLTTRSLANTAREILADTRDAAADSINDLRTQVEELWAAAGELMPRPDPKVLMDHVESTLENLRNRDLIAFPRPGTASS